jgi:hypothetical protein
MASLDSLPADQRAVIQLVLQQGRSYDDIATLLSIDRAGVRQRALDAFDALGPGNSIPAPQRALLTDYLLGQLPSPIADQVRDRVADSPGERAWLRVVASEVGSMARSPLPEIPAAGAGRAPAAQPDRAAEAGADRSAAAAGTPPPESAAAAGVAAAPEVTGEGRPRRSAPGSGSRRPDTAAAPLARTSGPSSSRRGGAILLGLGALIVAAVVIVLLVTGGGGKKLHQTAANSTPAASTPTSSSSTPTTSTTPKLLTQVNLNSPTGSKSRKGIAQVISEGTTLGVLIVAQNVPANTTKNAYAVWLYNSRSDSKLIGFVNKRVGSNGKLETEGPLPSNTSHYKHMLVTLETQQKPAAPGPVVLEGPLNLS